MSVLTASRDIGRKGAAATAVPQRITTYSKAGAKGFKGGLVAVDATGYAVSGTGIQSNAVRCVGVCIVKDWDNTSGANGAIPVDVERGIYPFANLGGDPVTQAQMFQVVYAEDDQTVRATNGTSTRSPAGLFVGFDEAGLPLVQVGNFSQTGV